MSDEPLDRCARSAARPVERVLHSPAVHFKGSGFYNTDYGTKKRQREKSSRRRVEHVGVQLVDSGSSGSATARRRRAIRRQSSGDSKPASDKPASRRRLE